MFPQDTCKAEKKQGAGHQAEGDADPGGGVHEKWFRHDVDQKIGPRIELPEIVGKEDFVENNKIFRKISGNDPGKQGGHAQKLTRPGAEHPWQQVF